MSDTPTPQHLQATPLIDAGHPDVQAFARDHAQGAGERARAVALVHAVRDGFRYDPYRIDLSPDGMRASTVLANGMYQSRPKRRNRKSPGNLPSPRRCSQGVSPLMSTSARKTTMSQRIIAVALPRDTPPTALDTGAAQPLATAQGPPRSAGGVPLPASRSEAREGGRRVAPQGDAS